MTSPLPELSHPVRVERITAAPMSVTLAPDGSVRSALARRFDLVAVDSFAAELTLRRRPDSGWIEVAGTVTAAVTQTCVVTMDPVPATVHGEVMELFDDSGELDAGEIDLDPMAETPEPVPGDILDVGEIVAQTFGLSLDPYPRTAGVAPLEIGIDGTGSEAGSPFAKLAALRQRPDEKA